MTERLLTGACAFALALAWTVVPASATTHTVKDDAERAKDKAENKIERAADKTENKAERAADKAENKMERAKDKTSNAVDRTKAKAAEVKDTVKNKLSGRDGNDDVRQAQQALQDKGISPGPVDGLMGPQTRAALRQYQQKENLKVTGRLDSDTKDRLLAGKTTSAAPSASPSTTSSTSSTTAAPTDAQTPSSMPAGAATAPGTGAEATKQKQTR